MIEEVVKLIPNKPIRFVINSHQHFDHAGGLRTYMHIGATIITHVKNFNFYVRDFLNYSPRTLQPDMMSLWPPTEVAEGYFYETVRENYVISDGTRNLNIYYVNPLQHVEGMLIAYLPKEKILMEADLVDTNTPLPARLTTDQQSFYRAVRTLKLDPGQMVPVHGNPVPWATFATAAGGELAEPRGRLRRQTDDLKVRLDGAPSLTRYSEEAQHDSDLNPSRRPGGSACCSRPPPSRSTRRSRRRLPEAPSRSPADG